MNSLDEIQYSHYFGGSPLDRSVEGQKNPSFLRNCIDSMDSVFILSDSGKTLAVSTSNPTIDSTEHDIELFMGTKDFVYELLEIKDSAALIENYPVVLLGCSYSYSQNLDTGTLDPMPIWHIAVDTKLKSEDDFINRSLNILKSNQISKINQNMKLIAVDGRSLLYNSTAIDISIGGQALALLSFHNTNKYHSQTGSLTKSIESGAKRECMTTQKKIYPRVDPVAISCVISPDGNQCLLGRTKRFGVGFYSCLSGFVEPSESVEEAVRREVWEEAGVRIGRVSIIQSQPWPIGRGGGCELMLGCVARANSWDINISETEMDDVRWFSREQAKSMLLASNRAYSKRGNSGNGEFFLPSERAIAHHLVKEFVYNKPSVQDLFSSSSRLVFGNRLDMSTLVSLVGLSGIALEGPFSIKVGLLRK
eukprot:gene6474-13073_t